MHFQLHSLKEAEPGFEPWSFAVQFNAPCMQHCLYAESLLPCLTGAPSEGISLCAHLLSRAAGFPAMLTQA